MGVLLEFSVAPSKMSKEASIKRLFGKLKNGGFFEGITLNNHFWHLYLFKDF